MVLKHKNPKPGLCPYCYEGYLKYDDHTSDIYCGVCNYVALVRGLNE